MSVKSTIAILVSALLLSACMVQSKVQGRYVEDQGQCRDSAEGNIGSYEKPGLTTKDRNAQLVTLFANCMAKHGWQVAKPKRTTTTGPHGPLDPYGSSAKTTTTTTTAGPAQPLTQQQYQEQQQALIRRQQELAQRQRQVAPNSPEAAELARQQQEVTAQQLQLQQRWQAQQRVFEGAGTQAPVPTTTTTLAPSGGMPPLSQPTGSYYQPARPYASPVAEPYGAGAGRNF